MTSCKSVDTPVSPSKVILLQDHSFSDPTRFRQNMGALQYLTFTRLDICFAVNRVCQFMHALTYSHWAVVKRILCYLRGMTSYGFHITRGSSFALHGFTDADWAGSIDDRKSTSDYLVFFVKRRFLGNPASNALLLAPLLRLSIKPLLMVQLKSYGSNTC